MKRALISVSNKKGLVEFAKGLIENNYEIISTGGTAKYLEENNIKTTAIENVTGFKEIMDGRVKTLHPKIHGGLLGLRDKESHLEQMRENEIEKIDMVVVNLYPFEEVLNRGGVPHGELIENIDIGGPSMVRSGAKNYKFVTVVMDPENYGEVLEEIKIYGDTTLETREKLAGKVFLETAYYDSLIGNYLIEKSKGDREKLVLGYKKVQDLRYGENPHQGGSFYKNSSVGYSLANGKQLNGKELSYNNIQDGNIVLEILKEFAQEEKIACVGVKHMNPCAIALGENTREAWERTYEGDKISIFGGIVGTTGIVDEETAKKLVEIFLEIVIAKGYTEKALEILKSKKNLRVLEIDMDEVVKNKERIVSVLDGVLVQDLDITNETIKDYKLVTETEATEEDMKQLEFAWKAVKHIKSNGIVICKDYRTIGIGAGQMNRVGAAKLALDQGEELCKGAYMASDAFFPMDDTVELAAQYGIKSIIQPGGSIKDQMSIDKCNENRISMVFTGVRHFKH
ncbi:bifunctional phosphoribosylaminoimidazolecarboxamide formyltransferase/IMP cyclohydrolase [Cetobacterium sp. SF1]|uniref:bifunctional phosphoribosylaminoimidazolecarboxamide formyltransferase/IMP cyclohydrolase n=1 Tax=Cetobacterium sp. SF1 TaxID=3417654 RepID=UPI003CE80224